jgi:hypothetical protein
VVVEVRVCESYEMTLFCKRINDGEGPVRVSHANSLKASH